MPFKSKAQRRLFFAMEARGEVPAGTTAKWEAHTPKSKKLPERVGKQAECPDWVAKVASLSAVLPQSQPALTINPQPQLTKSTVPVPRTPIRGYVPAQFRQGGLFSNRGIKSLAMNVGMSAGPQVAKTAGYVCPQCQFHWTATDRCRCLTALTGKSAEATPLPPPAPTVKPNWSDEFINKKTSAAPGDSPFASNIATSGVAPEAHT